MEETPQSTTTEAATAEKEPEAIKHTVTKRIHNAVPEFTFVMHGYKEDTTLFRGFSIDAIEIVGDEFFQRLDGFKTDIDEMADYGLLLEDYNHDGYLDVRLHSSISKGDPSLFWLWDENQQKFVENEQLQDISNVGSVLIDESAGRIVSFSMGYGARGLYYYSYINDEFIMVETDIEYDPDMNEGHGIREVHRLINGEMKLITREKVEEPQ